MTKNLKYFFGFITLYMFTSWSSADDPCFPQSCDREQHTLCKYPCAGPGPSCNLAKSFLLTDTEQQEILDMHNKLRNKVASGQETDGNPGPQRAGIIPDIQWDSELAYIAQRWCDQCLFDHDRCRNVARFMVGQNIAQLMHNDDYGGTMSDLIQLWYDEVKLFNSAQVSKFDPEYLSRIGHYTQLVWGNTTSIGCGLVRYKNLDNYFITYLVCNYGPAGNIQGEPIYQTSS